MIRQLIISTGEGGGTIEPVNNVDVVLIWAQSNLDGRNLSTERPVNVPNPNPNVKIYDAGAWINWNHEEPPVMFTYSPQWAADTIYLQQMYEYNGKTQYASKKSRGGTGLKIITGGNGDWNIASSEPEDHYLPFRQRIINTKNLIEFQGQTMRVPFIWADIGETDSLTSDKATFKANFKNFSEQIRQLTGNLRTPIVHRKLQLIQSGVEQWFLDAQEEFAAGEINDYHLIRNNYTLQDAYHLDSASSVQYADDVFQLTKDW